jgi:hypothetical protein
MLDLLHRLEEQHREMIELVERKSGAPMQPAT